LCGVFSIGNLALWLQSSKLSEEFAQIDATKIRPEQAAPIHIMARLVFVGGILQARSFSQLSNNDISYIMNTSPLIPAFFPSKIHYRQVSQNEDLLSVFESAEFFVQEAANQRQACMISGMDGEYTHLIVAVAIVMCYLRLELVDALQYVGQQVCHQIFLDDASRAALEQWDLVLRSRATETTMANDRPIDWLFDYTWYQTINQLVDYSPLLFLSL
jgi:hypothetical protein